MRFMGRTGGAAVMLAAIFGIGLFCAGCGDYYRPVANPIVTPGGDPQRTRHAVVLSTNGAAPGTAVNIDVSGDTNVGTFTVGRNPVHAASIAGGLHPYVAVHDDDAVASYTLVSLGNPPNITTLPTGAAPSYVAVVGISVFVAESGLHEVAHIDASSNALTAQIQVGTNPVALVAKPDGTKLYSINRGSNDVSVILPGNDTAPTTIALGAGASPIGGAVSSDGTQVFVVNQGSNSVAIINTISDTVATTLDLGAGAAPTQAVFETTLKRAYVISPGTKALAIINANTSALQTVSMSGTPCNQSPSSVTALANGSRVYVADDVTSTVCILDTTSNTFIRSIQVDANPISIVSDSDSSRVYTANRGTPVFHSASISRSANTVTVNTVEANPFAAGQLVTIAGVSDTTYNGQFAVNTVNSSTQFTYLQTGPDSTSSGGTALIQPDVSIILPSLDTTLKQNDGVTPLTIKTSGIPTFIGMAP